MVIKSSIYFMLFKNNKKCKKKGLLLNLMENSYKDMLILIFLSKQNSNVT